MKPLLESDQAKGAKPSRCQSASIAHRRGNGVSRLVSNRRVSHDDFHVPKQTQKTPAGMGTSADGGKDALEIGVPRDFDAAVHEREVPKRIVVAPFSTAIVVSLKQRSAAMLGTERSRRPLRRHRNSFHN
ncbi:hypothetical protein TbgDal_X1150 [Trypanosoma brucei gambiense DAL972]|uniref:Uncharacterized protein n=1 Tax=Trypanosoma brucei gambiense (strain MHOM/CI/86/DAL972) TaxID=679716 RepID=D0A192_TRYB9|nr:hypothetical protein TbgDal_X1150 [Trypanosoma brucei gambiense DAL972]CBH15034.1 hypothetical protein TbgDal_X1150 [Trypanosoma brucei gambiense DAL972]|eukprot:XP_011777300.1 hypothetical protein TbgDal_X1150 [Trypanosoma brucei gambiense DAL972]